MLSLDPAHVDLSRLNGGAPLLNTHGAYDLEDVLGVVEAAWIDTRSGTPVVAVADGSLFNVGWNGLGGWRLWVRDTIDRFEAMLRDPAALAEADREKLEIDPVPGVELQALVEKLARTPPATLDAIKQINSGK